MNQDSLFAGLPEQPVFTVSEALDYLNALMGATELQVQGETTGCSVHPSGVYFSIKDSTDESLLNCYLNPRLYAASGLRLEDGMQVKITGLAQVYKAKGRLSLQVRTFELVGEGTLKKAYDVLKEALQREGLFDRKRPLPECMTRIGLVTSRTGAVIADFRRNVESLGLQLYLYDARVEGALAVDQVTAGIEWFNAHKPDLDVLVVMRGGGSLEDLAAFNNERVARAVFASRIPTICAIGHDRDVPIASLVGDAMTSTPTAAAVLVNQSWQPLRDRVPLLAAQLVFHAQDELTALRTRIAQGTGILATFLDRIALIADRLTDQLKFCLEKVDQQVRQRMLWLEQIHRYLAHVNPERQLELGYSLATDARGKIIRSVRSLPSGKRFNLRLADGTVASITE